MIKKVNQLLIEYRSRKNVSNPKKIKFLGIDGLDGYNISAPFKIGLETFLAARVEKRDSEDSKIMFFNKKNSIENEEYWELNTNILSLNLQDPFFCFIDNQIIIGGVEIEKIEDKISSWKTVFYKGKDLFSLKKFFVGPNGMKDLRISQLEDNKIAIFTRPQGEKGGRGKIGFTIVNSLKELTVENILNAPILEMFDKEEWGGANEIHVLDNDRLGVLGHIAKFGLDMSRHYYPISFVFSIKNGTYSNLKIICERNDFLDGNFKREDLIDVVFSGGIILNDEKATLYCGTSDCEAQCINILNPFI